ncbi:MAG: hypothetical protein J2P58_01545 [Acidimicrobiaceae bacterium]|nr:hypothetical protein [Acidimicrobiaceae bacterium]MBO0746730.1 hypothetical protein [Acidimicrobiaceae bacterium]
MSPDAGGRTITLDAPTQTHSLNAVHDALNELWTTSLTVSEPNRLAFNTAVIEITGDIIRHSRSPDFHLSLTLTPTEAVAEFEDRGIKLPGNLATILSNQADDLSEQGRGLRLAHDASDQIIYRRQNDTNHWTVRRWLSP